MHQQSFSDNAIFGFFTKMPLFFKFFIYTDNIFHKLCKQQTATDTNKCDEDEAVKDDYQTDHEKSRKAMIQTAQPQPYFHQHHWWCGIIQFVRLGHKI